MSTLQNEEKKEEETSDKEGDMHSNHSDFLL